MILFVGNYGALMISYCHEKKEKTEQQISFMCCSTDVTKNVILKKNYV